MTADARDLYASAPAPAVERLARIEGQSNFLSILAGIEAGPDTTEDMGALAFARVRGCVPEALEANVAQSVLFRLPLMSVVWHAVLNEWSPKQKDFPWVQGAIADAFLLLRTGYCNTVESRAKRFKVDRHAYGAMRRTAGGVFLEMIDAATREFLRARRSTRETTTNRHTANERGDIFQTPAQLAAIGSYRAGVTEASPDDEQGVDDGREDQYAGAAPGMADHLTWDERNAAPSPVLTITGENPE